MKRTRGFSLIEVMIAIMVLLVGISGVTHALWWATQHEKEGSRMSEATNHARVVLERIIPTGVIAQGVPAGGWPTDASGLHDDPTERRPLYSGPPNVLAGLGAHLNATDTSQFSRNIRVERLSADTDSHEYTLAVITVRVFWNEQGHERSVELQTVVPHGIAP
ncbi:MAG: prepilin-type N-terminal cleavage/methylation domain-containing protein [Armatimonadetes bacterium]|nr:prepilin-type N-terminal cleavage/methylation domain-containing protein [Armatimonadota bacterium]